jgi:hypothetical protein
MTFCETNSTIDGNSGKTKWIGLRQKLAQIVAHCLARVENLIFYQQVAKNPGFSATSPNPYQVICGINGRKSIHPPSFVDTHEKTHIDAPR